MINRSMLDAKMKLTELAQHNAYDHLIAACEMTTESGCNYMIALKEHADILEQYVGQMKQRLQHLKTSSYWLGILIASAIGSESYKKY